MQPDYDVLIIGSGFGGSVSALRLTEKGYRVGVLEAGRRFTPETLPKTSWDLRNFLWAPKLGMRGIQRITLLKDIVVLSADYATVPEEQIKEIKVDLTLVGGKVVFQR